jgi:phage pi2 protein 07
MTTLRKQLKDPIFAAWMAKTPRKDRNPAENIKNWRVLVQKEKGGRWARAEFYTYDEAYAWVMKNLEKYHDLVLTSKLYPFKPPIIRNKVTNKKHFYYPGTSTGEKWCPFCRRMSKFGWFKKHHNVKAYTCGQTKQCHTCGAGIKFANIREWKW